MSEQEERIAIYKTYDKVIEGGYGDFYETIPRQEAVERMAAEMFGVATAVCDDAKKNWRNTDLLPSTIDFYVGMAEAALDALLGK